MTHSLRASEPPASCTLSVLNALEDGTEPGMPDQLQVAGLFGGGYRLKIVEEKRAEWSRVKDGSPAISVKGLLGVYNLYDGD